MRNRTGVLVVVLGLLVAGGPATAGFSRAPQVPPLEDLTLEPEAPPDGPQDDAGSGGDAGDSFEDATPITPRGTYTGHLNAENGDVHDVFRFPLDEGDRVTIDVDFREPTSDPIRILDPEGRVVDAGTRALSVNTSSGTSASGEFAAVRLTVLRAVVGGDYRLHLSAENARITSYTLCFVNCEAPREAPIDFIFGGSLPTTDTRVLLVPPPHGDLGNPTGPTALDYLDAILRGIHGWTAAMDAFADDYPEYAYLREITVHVEIFDGVSPVDPAGYDVIIGYVPAGPVFRGVATQGPEATWILRRLGIDGRFSGRLIALSLFGASPRAGQTVWDFPEAIDLEIVTFHEFGHTFGLGHTVWWDPELGPDLMNSPAPFVYGDGSPVGDGGEHTARVCLSSLDLYGMAVLYRWVPDGPWQPTYGSAPLPEGMPYRWYCT